VCSTELVGTAIVPTLDTPLAKSGNAVWCATFQVAWNHARDDVVGGPLRIANAQNVADRLNGSSVSEAVLPSDTYYAAAGRLEDGIIQTIHDQMARRFPGVHPPTFEDAVGFVAYSYLDTKATFTTPFADLKRPIQFSDAAGVARPVSGFGLYEGTDFGLRTRQAAQVQVLFSETDDGTHWDKPTAFALDLTAGQADQVIIAVMPRSEFLRDAVDELARQIVKHAPDEGSAELEAIDIIAVPNVAFNVDHEFAELQGLDKIIENPGKFHGLYILKAWQSICFRLDKSGVAVASESGISLAPIPRQFIVDQPFLIVMKRRSAEQPYFVAWIENTELLQRSPGGTSGGT
jgi:hypothetical protein